MSMNPDKPLRVINLLVALTVVVSLLSLVALYFLLGTDNGNGQAYDSSVDGSATSLFREFVRTVSGNLIAVCILFLISYFVFNRVQEIREQARVAELSQQIKTSIGMKYEILQRNTTVPVLSQIGSLLDSAKAGECIFSTATVPLRTMGEYAYEDRLVAKSVALAKSSYPKIVLTRIISNANHPEMKAWINDIKDPSNKTYASLQHLVRQGRAVIYTLEQPLGLDLLLIAGQERKVVLLGVKEQPMSTYFDDGMYGELTSRGNTYCFENEDMADSIYNYYANFICGALEKQNCRLAI